MKVYKANSRLTGFGGNDYFTGTVTQEPIIAADEPSRLRALRVTFTPGGRTHWHSHPLGQVLYVLSGVGRVQKKGEPVQEILAGDTVHIAPGELHWHGAAPDHGMCHIAMQEALDGTFVTWDDAVSDEDYTA